MITAGGAQDFVFAGNMQGYTGNVSMYAAATNNASTTLGNTASNIVQYGGETAGGNTALGTVTTDGSGKWINNVAGSGTITGNNVIFNYGTDASYDYVKVTNTIAQRKALWFLGNANVLLSGSISDAGFLSKAGTGTLTLSGTTNSYYGATTLIGGNLAVAKLANGGALSSTGSSSNAAANLVFNGGALTYTGAGDSTDRAFTITAAPTINANGSGALTWSGASPTFTTAGQAYLVTLGGTSTAANTFGTVLADNAGGAVSLRKSGAGKWVLTGTNTFTGTTAIAAGTLEIGSAGVLGSGSYAGAIANEGALSVATSANQTLAGAISGGGSLAKSGAGKLTLSAVNTYGGATTITSGTVEVAGAGLLGSGSYAGAIANDGALAFTTSANQILSGGVGGTGTLRKAGTGQLTLLGNNGYSGATTVDSGTLVVGGQVSSSSITVNGSGLAVVNGLVSSSAITVNAGGILGGSGTTTAPVTLVGGAVSPGNSPGTLTVGDMSWDATSSYKWELYDYQAGAGTGWDLLSGTGALTVSGTGFTFNLVSLATPSAVGPAFNWSQTTSGTFRMASFAGGITAPGGTWWTISTGSFSPFSTVTGSFGLLVGANDIDLVYTYIPPPKFVWTVGSGSWSTAANWSTDPQVPAGSAELIFAGPGGTATNDLVSGTGTGELTMVTGLTFSGSASGSYTLDGNAFTLGSAGIVNQSSFMQTVQNGLTLGAAASADAQAADLVLSGTVATAGYTFTVTGSANSLLSGVVTGSGGLAKLGAGTLTLTGSNDFTGGTTITSGTVVVGDGATAGVLPGSVTNNGALVFSRSDDVTFAGNIGGTGAVTKLGGNTLTLTGSAGWSGPTTISGGTLAFAGSASQTLAGAISGAGALVKSGPGSLALTGVNTYAGDTTISSGTLVIGGAGQLGGGAYAGAIANAGVLSVATTANQTLSGVISGTGSLAKSAAGTLTLTATNTYTGNTTISSGTLVIGGAGQLGGGSYAGAIANAGTLAVATTANQTLSGTISGGGSIVKSAAGTLKLTAANSWSGGTTLESGTLVAANSNALGTVGTITINTAATGASNTSLLIDASAASGTIARPITVANQGSGVTTIGSGSLAGSNGARFSGAITLGKDVTLVGADSGDRTDFAGGISGTGNVTVTTAGSGRVIFMTTANTFSGDVTISPDSVLQLSDGSATSNSLIPDGANVTVGSGGALKLAKNGNSESINALLGSGTVTAIAGADTLVVGASGGTGIFSGVLTQGSGTLALTKQGAGTQTLSGTSSYTGVTTLTAGTLALAGNNSLGSNLSNAASGTTAVLSFGANTVFIGNSLANSGGFYYGLLDGSGTMQLRGGSATIQNADGTQGTNGNYQLFVPVSTLSPTAFALNTGVSDTDRKDFGYANDTGSVLALSSLSGYGAIRGDVGGTNGTAVTRSILVDQATNTVFNGAVLSHVSGPGAVRQLTLTKAGAGSLELAGFIGKETISSGAGPAAVNLVVTGGLLNVTNAANSTTTLTGALNSSGTVTITSGTLGFANQALVNTAGSAGFASIQMNGGVLRWNTGNTQDITAGGRLALVNATTATFDTNGNTVTLAGGLGAGTSASLAKAGAGTLTLTGSSGYTGATSVNAGTLAIAGAGNIASSPGMSIAPGAVLDIAAAAGLVDVGALSGAGNVTLGGNSLRTTVASGSSQFSGVVSGSGGFTKAGAGTLALTGSQAFTGIATIETGTVVLAAGTELEQATAIAVLATGILDTPGLTVVSNQTLGGYGTVNGPVTFASGGVLSPGGSVGTLTNDGSTTWNGGTHYLFEINNATGTAGQSAGGWDLYNVTGGLVLSVTGTDKIVIDLASLSGTSSGLTANFDENSNYQWLIADAGAEISPFDPTSFQVLTTNFQNLPGSADRFFVVRGDTLGFGNDQLFLTYVAVPEPGTLALAGIGLAAASLAATRRRRHRCRPHSAG